MKLSKKVLAALSTAALLVTSFAFTSCGEEDDDENGMLSGSGNNYSLSYDNTNGEKVSRGYKTTSLSHRGALTKITLNKDSLDGTASLGYMWDLKSVDAKTVSAKPREFLIVGFNYGMTKANNVAYYVSKYSNVYDIEAANFGTEGKDKVTGESTGGATVNGKTEYATEHEFIQLNATNTFVPTKDADGNVVVTVNVTEEKNADGTYTGGYVVDIYDGEVTKDQIAAASIEPKDHTVIAADYVIEKDATTNRVAEQSCAVYANVYKGKKATASWKYLDTYSADEVIEE